MSRGEGGQGQRGKGRGWLVSMSPGGVAMAVAMLLPPSFPHQCHSLSRHSWSLGARAAPYLWLCFPELNSTKCDNQN